MHLAKRCMLPGAMLFAAAAMGQNLCVQNEYNLVNRQKLNCTANDVRIAKVANVRDPLTGAAITTCQAGQTFNFLADFQIVTTSSQARENIGLYIATNSQTQAMTGACEDHVITQRGTCATGSQQCGSDNYHETDPPPDNCGDTSSNDFSSHPTLGGKGVQVVTLEIDNFLCQAPAGTNQVQLPNCTSWQIPGGTIQCQYTNPDDYPLTGPGGTPAAIPGSPAKCNCDIIPLGVTVQNPQITVGKTCSAGTDVDATTCNIFPEGGSVTYTVTINNTSNFGDIVVDQVCDDQFGTIFRAGSFTGTACPAGTVGTKSTLGGTTCNALTVPSGGSRSCTFSATQVEDVTVTDIVTVQGHGSQSGTFGPTQSNSVTVISHEAPTTGTVTKGFVANVAGCATVKYSVQVTNTSAAGTDETLTVNTLSDGSFGSLTAVSSTVLGTTCGQATSGNGAGTLSGVAGAGTLPKTLPIGQSYSCQFVAQICGNLDNNGCFTHSNTVNAGATDDEGGSVSVTAGSLNLKECLSGSVVQP